METRPMDVALLHRVAASEHYDQLAAALYALPGYAHKALADAYEAALGDRAAEPWLGPEYADALADHLGVLGDWAAEGPDWETLYTEEAAALRTARRVIDLWVDYHEGRRDEPPITETRAERLATSPEHEDGA